MMKKLCAGIILLLLAGLCACGQAEPEETSAPITTTATQAATTTEAPTTTMPPTTGYINPDYLDRITPSEGYQIAASAQVKGKAFDYVVYELTNGETYGGKYFDAVVLKNGKFLCVLHPQEWDMMGSDEVSPVMERDVDFDGKPDVLLYTGHYGNQAGVYYECWLQRGSGLEYCPSFYEIMNPAVSDGTKEILSCSRANAATHCYMKYKFINGAFVLTEMLTEEPAGWGEPGQEPQTKPDGSPVWAWSITNYLNGKHEYFTENDYDEEALAKKVYGKDSPWDITGDRWRALYNNGLMADFSIYG